MLTASDNYLQRRIYAFWATAISLLANIDMMSSINELDDYFSYFLRGKDLVMDIKHNWKFFRAGGFDQVQLDTGADLVALKYLDQKLWVALSCPTRGIEFDNRTLDMIDADGDGQVRASEILAAI